MLTWKPRPQAATTDRRQHLGLAGGLLEQELLGPGLGSPRPCPLCSPHPGTAAHGSVPPHPPAPGRPCHSLVQPPVESQADERLGALGVCPPAGDEALVVIVAAQGLQWDGLCPGRGTRGSHLSPADIPCPLPSQPFWAAQSWGKGVS